MFPATRAKSDPIRIPGRPADVTIEARAWCSRPENVADMCILPQCEDP